MNVIDALDSAYDHGQTIFDGISRDQLDGSTPCPNFTVRQLVGHAVDVIDRITMATGGEPAPATDGDRTDDPGAAFRDATARSKAAWRNVESLDAPVKMPWGDSTFDSTARMGLADVLAHTWDAAVATGQRRELPAEPAEVAYDFAKGMLSPEFRAEGPDARFGPEVTVADDAPITDRLVGWLGRDPNAQPGR